METLDFRTNLSVSQRFSTLILPLRNLRTLKKPLIGLLPKEMLYTPQFPQSYMGLFRPHSFVPVPWSFLYFRLLMKMLITFLLMIMAVQAAISQSEGTLDIHFIPFPLYDRNPRVRMGIEYHGYDRLGYNLEIGIGNTHLNAPRLNGIFGKNYSFLEIQTELKWYLNDLGAVSKYFAADVFYLHMKDELENGYYYPAFSTDVIRYENASFMKQKLGILIKGGFKFLIWKRVVIDFYEGVGLALRDIQYTNLTGLSYQEINVIEEWWSPPHLHAGNVVLGQFATGIKIGCVIGKIK